MCTKVISLQECSETRPGQLERVRFFPRMLLSVEDMITESDYFRKKLKRHNQYLHGTGIVCGLEVTSVPSPAPPTAVQIAAGYALGPYGDEIFVGEPLILDLAKCRLGAATDPCEPNIIRGGNGTGETLILAIKFDECFARPVRAMPAGCACEDEDCEYSRIRDSFQISCLDHIPAAPTIPPLCDFVHDAGLLTCPNPTEPWVVLARVTLPSGGNAMSIDKSVRRYVFGTAIIQEQLIKCCCNGDKHVPPPPILKPVRVVSIEPGDNTQFGGRGQPAPPSTLVITFDKRLSSKTITGNVVVTQQTEGQSSQPVAGTLAYDDSQKQITFTPTGPDGKPIPFLGESGTGEIYKVTVRGSGATPLKDLDDLALDGNGDGSPGDDFNSSFTVFAQIG